MRQVVHNGLLLINRLCYTCGERKIWQNNKDCQNIMTMVVVNKKDYRAKILDIKSKYITTADSNKFFNDVVANKIKSEGLANHLLLLDSQTRMI